MKRAGSAASRFIYCLVLALSRLQRRQERPQGGSAAAAQGGAGGGPQLFQVEHPEQFR